MNNDVPAGKARNLATPILPTDRTLQHLRCPLLSGVCPGWLESLRHAPPKKKRTQGPLSSYCDNAA
ncbi:MAG: hypothetical protein ACTHKB_01400, partial [Burkholderiaceae bacterium]